MRLSRTAQYVIVFVVAAAAILTAGWFLVLSPRLDSVAVSQQDARDLDEANRALAARIAALGNVDQPALKTQLDSLRRQVPGDLDLPEFTREIASLANSTGVRVASVDRSQAAAAQVQGAFAVPVTVSAEGDDRAARSFLAAVQKSDRRLLLVNGLSLKQGEGDTPAVTITLNCTVFVFDDAAASAAAPPGQPGAQAGAEPRR